jgi:hypothetical protein
LLRQRIASVVVLVEDAELQRGHGFPRKFVVGGARPQVESALGGRASARAFGACPH